jgi:hypothetical protein
MKTCPPTQSVFVPVLLAISLIVSVNDLGHSQRTFANSQTTSTSGACVGSSISNPGNAADGNYNTYSTITMAVGVGCTISQTLIYPGTNTNTGCDSLVILVNSASMASLTNNVIVETFNGGSSNGDAQNISSFLQLLSGNDAIIKFNPSSTFDRVRISVSSLVGLGFSLNIRYSYWAPRINVPGVTPADATICNGGNVNLTGSIVSEANTIRWFTVPSGGSHIDTGLNISVSPTSTTSYYAEAYSTSSGCKSLTRFEIPITVQQLPTSNPGPDSYTCESTPYDLSSAAASNYTSLLWSTSGDGLFSNSGVLQPSYTPGSADLVNETARLILVAYPLSACSDTVRDTLDLQILRYGAWAGLANTPSGDNWNNASNWCGGIPDSATDVTIPALLPSGNSFWPTIGTGNAVVRNITLQNLGSLTMNSNDTLTVHGIWDHQGSTVTMNQGTVVFAGSVSEGQIKGSSPTTFYNLDMRKAGGMSLSLNLNTTVSNTLRMVSGNIVPSGSNYIELGTSTSNTGQLSYSGGTVVGIIKRWFSASTNSGTTGLFPIGNIVTGTTYHRPMQIEYTKCTFGWWFHHGSVYRFAIPITESPGLRSRNHGYQCCK